MGAKSNLWHENLCYWTFVDLVEENVFLLCPLSWEKAVASIHVQIPPIRSFSWGWWRPLMTKHIFKSVKISLKTDRDVSLTPIWGWFCEFVCCTLIAHPLHTHCTSIAYPLHILDLRAAESPELFSHCCLAGTGSFTWAAMWALGSDSLLTQYAMI